MKLKLQSFIENKLAKASYEFDESVGQWAGYIKSVPGVYAQANDIETVRQELAEILEEWVFAAVHEKSKIRGLNISFAKKAKAYA